MSTITRREFLVGAAAAGTAVLAGPRSFSAETATVARGTDLVTLGNSGLKTTMLGLGTGTRGGSEQREIGQAKFTALVRHALDRGIQYVDTADAYRAHPFVRKALAGVPRDRYFVQTKTRAKDAEKAKADIERFRSELQIDRLDTLLMHCMQQGGWPSEMRPVMDVLEDAKQKGRVGAVGVSCHGLDPLKTAADCDWIDVHLVRINPFGAKMDGKPEEVAEQIEKMHGKGRGVIGMKIFGENGFDSLEQRLQSLKYVLGLGTVHAFTIGFVSTQQIDETLDLIERAQA